MDAKNVKLPDDFIQLARTAMAGRPQDIQLFIHRASKKYREEFPQMTEALVSLLRESPSRSSPLRKHADLAVPVDLDSRLQLLRVESGSIDVDPILSEENERSILQVLQERQNSEALYKLGLHPTKSILFTGPPGVGKTLTAKWIASKLKKPLLILDLSAVMSSFLGRTGNNIRHVLDYAKNMDCVLLLDELDAIAKRRDDVSEVGELKRLVTVLLQEIDDWPPTGLLLAATNHPLLLDPAIWRRFELVMNFENPERNQIEIFMQKLLSDQIVNSKMWSMILSYVFFGSSYSDIERQINIVRKSSAIGNNSMSDAIQSLMRSNSNLTKEQRVELACLIYDNGLVSQRQAQEITGIARDTIRKHNTQTQKIENVGENSIEGKKIRTSKKMNKKVNHGTEA